MARTADRLPGTVANGDGGGVVHTVGAAVDAIVPILPADDPTGHDAGIRYAREQVAGLIEQCPASVPWMRRLVIQERCRMWKEAPEDAAAVANAVIGSSGEGEGGERVPTVRTLAEILENPAALDPPAAVVPRLAWAGRVTLLAAREKLGKSTLASAGAAAVTRGGHHLGDPCANGPILWVALEEHISDLAGRLRENHADADQTYIVDRVTDPLRDLARAVEVVQPTLIVVDTLATLVDALAERPDPGSSSAWTPVMQAVSRIARDTDAAVLLIHHARKSDGAYRDSTAIGAGVDVLLEMHEGQDGGVRRMKARARWNVGDYSVRWMGASGYELTAGEVSIDARILLHVEGYPGCSMRELRSSVSGRSEAIRAAADRLIERGAIADRGEGNTCRLYAGTSGSQSGSQGGQKTGAGTGSGTGGGSAGNPQGTATEPVSGTGAVPGSESIGSNSGTAPAIHPDDELELTFPGDPENGGDDGD